MTQSIRDEIAQIVANLFKDGKTPSQLYGIDVQKIEEVELKYPHVSKQYPGV